MQDAVTVEKWRAIQNKTANSYLIDNFQLIPAHAAAIQRTVRRSQRQKTRLRSGGTELNSRFEPATASKSLQIAFGINQRHRDQPADGDQSTSEFESGSEPRSGVDADIHDMSHEPRCDEPGQRVWIGCIHQADIPTCSVRKLAGRGALH
jgi:hypothetical protein